MREMGTSQPERMCLRAVLWFSHEIDQCSLYTIYIHIYMYSTAISVDHAASHLAIKINAVECVLTLHACVRACNMRVC